MDFIKKHSLNVFINMNIKLFKKLIKDAVTEALYEELPEIINEVLVKQEKQTLKEVKSINFNSNSVPLSGDVRNQLMSKLGNEFGFNQPVHSDLKVIDKVDDNGEKVNPFLAFIKDAADNMTPHDKAGLRNLD